MPTPDDILRSLAWLSDKYDGLAIFWHGVLILFFLGLFIVKRKLSGQWAGYVAGLLFLSVSFLAWQIQNPFTGGLFLILGFLQLLLTGRSERKPVSLNPHVFLRTAGLPVFICGFCYPSILHYEGYAFLFSAPVGVIPCPTLLTVTGLIVFLNLRYSTTWFVFLILTDLFFGLFGAFRLGVPFDMTLMAASFLLCWQVMANRKVPGVKNSFIPGMQILR